MGVGAGALLTSCGLGGADSPTATPAPTEASLSVVTASEAPAPTQAATPPTSQTDQQAAQAEPDAARQEATPEQSSSEPEPAAEPENANVEGLPPGRALVTSPRLPLNGVGAAHVALLMDGAIGDWAEAGAPISVPVEPLGEVGADGYEDVVGQLAQGMEDLSAPVGRVAIVPVEVADFRVNVLSVQGTDPLRDRAQGKNGPIIRVGMVGDIVPGRNIHLTMERYNDFLYPFREVAPYLARYDLTIANLEGNISDSLENPVNSNPNTIDFVTRTAFLEGFALAGIDAVDLGNNHTHFNESGWGSQGLTDTMDALDAFGLPFFGAGRDIEQARQPFVATVEGVTFAFLGHDAVTANLDIGQNRDLGVVSQEWGAGPSNPGTNPFSLEQFVTDVAAAAEQYDVVIPYLHGGAEFKWVVPDWLQEAARAAVDAGAKVVVTNHPHIIQGMEVYNGAPIVYSLGNFIFDQMFSVDTRQGLVLDMTFDGDQIVGLRLHGVEIEDFCKPRLMSAPEQAAIMDRFWRSADRLAGR